jgi:60 kDa SS-A/Ro ribonucleoprotein
MRTNKTAVNNEKTFEGGPARNPKAEHQLKRQVATCMLFEDTFYESGDQIANEIAETCKKVAAEVISELAREARHDFKLRHVPLFLLAQLDARRSENEGLLKTTIPQVVNRPDEMGELLSIIGKVNPGKPLKKRISAQVKKGLAASFRKFSPYQLAKWNRDSEVKLRDVLFLTHAKPKDAEQAAVWKKLIDGTLEAPDTWEVALSAGADKKETWERLLKEEKLGYIALLMNLRNMAEADVDRNLVKKALLDGAEGSKALPFRFVSAAKAAPSYNRALSDAMLKAISTEDKLTGTTALLIDVSGSMDAPIANKSTLMRWEAGAALGILLNEICEDCRVYTFSENLVEVDNIRGLPLIKAVTDSQPHGGTYLGGALSKLFKANKKLDRVIVITDEQAHDRLPALPNNDRKGYIVNVAAYKPALALEGPWVRVSGFSERIVDYIRFEESQDD